MKLLILGESDSKGGGLDDPSQAWGELVPVELQQRLSQEVDCTHVRFFAHVPNCLDYLESLLAKGHYDAVLFSLTSIGFTLMSADNRVRRLMGKRAGAWFKRSADTFDSKTRVRGDEGVRRKLNRGAHRTVRTVIGQEPMLDYPTVLTSHMEILARLARLEDTEILLLGPTDHAGRVATSSRRTQPRVELFRAALHEEAERRRFLWLDRQALSYMGEDRDALFTDGLHKTPVLHRRIALGAVDLLAPRLR